jgi:hypothetical protein
VVFQDDPFHGFWDNLSWHHGSTSGMELPPIKNGRLASAAIEF